MTRPSRGTSPRYAPWIWISPHPFSVASQGKQGCRVSVRGLPRCARGQRPHKTPRDRIMERHLTPARCAFRLCYITN